MAAVMKSSFAGVRVKPAAPVVSARARVAVAPKALFGFGGAKPAADGGKPAAPAYYICLDCGWIYDKGDFKAAPASFKCPVCGVGKNRFKVYKGDDIKGRPNNTQKAMDARQAAKKW